MFVVDNDQFRCGILDDIGVARERKRRVERHIDFACFQRAKNCSDGRCAALEQQGHGFFAIAAVREDRVRDLIRRAIQIPIIDLPLLRFDGEPVAVYFDLALETRGDRPLGLRLCKLSCRFSISWSAQYFFLFAPATGA